MPNIEIHGLAPYETQKIVERITKCLENNSLVNETVITVIPSKVSDIIGNSAPFLRLYKTPDDPDIEIVEDLKKVGMDLEVTDLMRFIPKIKDINKPHY